MVTSLLFHFTQITSIWHIPTSFFKLINGQNSVPRRFPSKKANSHGSPRSPNNAPRKRFTRSKCEGSVERSNRKEAILANLSTQNILHITMQTQGVYFSEQALHIFHFPMLKCLENKGFQLPTSPFSSQASYTH